MCVPSYNFLSFIVPEESVTMNFHLWQIVKLIKEFKSKGYVPLALILVYTIHQSTVNVCTRFQLCDPYSS